MSQAFKNQNAMQMARSQDSWNKREREKKKQKEKQDKAEKKAERKQQGTSSIENMMAYIDENGNIVDSPPDPSKKIEVKLEDIVIGVPKYDPSAEEDVVRTGIVTFFNEGKGFGFIKDIQSQESIFVHVNACLEQIKENSRVSFEVERGPRGLQAANVKLSKG
jgi:cold shock CspA family protein